ncbi:heat shock protein beta-9 [Dunckerocampus dactyliophorus]|uniref:heat shock protein beta-9 n=1 Tax=Dunckerocampus dactyliophorus TaxID=161453 RepID=UPI0024066F24|nr:heat shock protein beta-9 [Dunckerocampus dactyliophorus]
MARHAALSSLFGDDPFFSQGGLLWPFSSLRQDLLGRKVQLADGFLFKDGPSLVNLPLMASTFKRLSSEDDKAEDEPRQTAVAERPRQAQQAAAHDDLLVTLDARGYAPGDITVKLEGRSLLVAATKQAGAQEAHSCASPSSRASFASSSSARMGFKQKIDLSPHLDLAGLSCSLMDDGQLRIHAPVAKQPITEERREPLEEEHKEPQEEEQTEPLEEEQRKPLEQEEEPPRFRTSLEFPITKENTD